jgi:hypothetical protein
VTRHRSIPLVLAAFALALGIVASACSAASGTAVSVNGTELSNKDFTTWLHAIASNKTLKAQTQTTGINASTYTTTFTTGVLNNQVTFVLIDQELARRHITLSPSDLSAAETSLQTQLAPSTTDPSTGQQTAGSAAQGKVVLDSLGSFKTALIRATAGQTALQKVYAQKRGSTAALQKLYDANPSQFNGKACVYVIEVPAGTGGTDASGNPVTPTASDFTSAQTEASQLRTQIAGAAAGDLASEFASAASTVAQQEGLQSDGDLGCQSKGAYTSSEPALEDAIWNGPVGDMSQPVKGSEGYFLVFVSARGDLTFDQAKAELQKAAANQALTDYKAWFDAATKKADVSVDPQWGSWDRKTGTIVAPAGATSSSTSTTKATGLGSSLNLGGSASTTTSTP